MPDVQRPNLFVHPAEPFSLLVPDGWSTDTSGQQGESVVLFGPEVDDNFRANVNVIVQELAPWTPEEYVTLSRLQLKKLSNLAALPVDEPAPRLPGGWLLEWTTWEAPIPVRGRQLLAFRDGKAFVVTATATAATWKRDQCRFPPPCQSRCEAAIFLHLVYPESNHGKTHPSHRLRPLSLLHHC